MHTSVHENYFGVHKICLGVHEIKFETYTGYSLVEDNSCFKCSFEVYTRYSLIVDEKKKSVLGVF